MQQLIIKALKFSFCSHSKLNSKIFRWQLELHRSTIFNTKEEILRLYVIQKTKIYLKSRTLKSFNANFVTRYANPITVPLSQVKEALRTATEIQPIKKQLQEVFCKKRCSQKFRKIHGKAPVPEPLSTTLLKKRLWHRCFPVNFEKFLRAPYLQNTSGRLLQHILKPLEREAK